MQFFLRKHNISIQSSLSSEDYNLLGNVRCNGIYYTFRTTYNHIDGTETNSETTITSKDELQL